MFWVDFANASAFMPFAATKIADNVDALYEFLLIASFISFVLVIGGMVYFAIKYRRKSPTEVSAYISHNSLLEFLWSFIPFVIFMFVFAWGWIIFHDMHHAPKDAFEIHVTAQKWFWSFEYKSGRKTSAEFYAPVGRPVKMIMTSRDVIHSFFVPAFRIKQDVVPGRYTMAWFQAEKPGTYQLFCTEFCGDGHSAMLAKVHVLPQEEFDQWLMNDPYKGLSPIEVGQQVFTSKCLACHNATAERKVGPGFAGLFGKTEHFEDGTSAVVDENYIHESILVPSAKVVKGFPNAMTPFQGLISEEEIKGVIEYIKSLK